MTRIGQRCGGGATDDESDVTPEQAVRRVRKRFGPPAFAVAALATVAVFAVVLANFSLATALWLGGVTVFGSGLGAFMFVEAVAYDAESRAMFL